MYTSLLLRFYCIIKFKHSFRFLPPGSYLDGRALGARKLANKMLKLINQTVQYYDYFRWHRYYNFHSPAEGAFTVELCDLCAVLSERLNSKKKSVFPDVVNWWNGKYSKNKLSTEAPTEDL